MPLASENCCQFSATEFIRRIPKTDVHVHFEGLLTPRPLRRCHDLALISGVDPDLFRSSFPANYVDLDEFINTCRNTVEQIRSEQDCFELVWGYLLDCHRQNVVHIEIAVEPQVHIERGFPFEALMRGIRKALRRGRTELGISSYLILSIVRDRPIEEAFRTFELVRRDPQDFVAVGLASRELGYPPNMFRSLFKAAKREGLRVAIHAGEEGPPEYIWSAVTELDADRIDHGLRAAEDPDLMNVLEDTQTPLALAPISYAKIGGLNAPRRDRLAQLLQSNLVVSINTDDPGLFEADSIDNYLYVVREFSLDLRRLVTLAENGVRASFLPHAAQADLLQKISAQRDAF